jgi:predicted extracellular nuclease
MRYRTFGVGVLAALAVLVVGAATTGAAGSPSIVISQVYGAGGNSGAVLQNDYIELFNRGTTTVPLSGWSVQYASATGTGNFTATPLSGSIAPGQYYLVKQGGGTNGSPLPAADATGSTLMAAGAGKVIVANTATSIACNGGSTACTAAQRAQIVDLVGYGTGTSGANFFEGTSQAPTIGTTTAAFRGAGGCQDTDDNGVDFTAAAPAPRNTQTQPAPCPGSTHPPGVGSADPSTVARGGSTLLSVAVTPGTGPASTGITVSGDLSSIGGSATTSFVDAGNNTFTFQTTVATATAPGTKSLPVTVADAQGRSTGTTIGLTVTDAFICGDPATKIHDIQGSGLTPNGVGSQAVVEGVVVGDYQQSGGFSGFYVEEEDADRDDNAQTSEGIFVFSSLPASVGDRVRVRGTVTEFQGLTELGSVNAVQVCPGGGTVTPAQVSLPVPSLNDLEAFEGMLVHFGQTLTATEVFNLGRFGEISLSGVGRLFTPTAVVAPGAPAIAKAAENNRSRIILDDGDNRQNIDPTIHPAGGLSASHTLRVGDTLNGLDGIMDYRFNAYRIQPVAPVSFQETNPRTDAPEPVGGNLKIASFNVLNYFNGPTFPTSRGAETPFELERQTAKEVAALKAMDADIVGLMEMENDSGANSALAQLVGALNNATAPGTYDYIDTGVIGTDEIKVALIYKPAAVSPVGNWKIITSAVDPEFIDTKSRPSLAQTFKRNATGAKLTVVVNHLKSKSSACDDVGDPDIGDGQGNCNQTRTKAARALVRWLQTDPTGSGDPDFLLIGDMNSYAMEDPITAFKAGGLHDLVAENEGDGAYSYVFNGESGYLDHAIGTGSLAGQIADIGHWHINPDEPTVLDYNVNFKTANQINTFYAPTPFRSSDHDPVLIGLNLAAPPTANAGGPYVVGEGGSVTVSASGTEPDGGALSYAWDLDNDGTFETAGQSASFSAAALDGPSTRTIRVRATNAAGLSGIATGTVTIENVAPSASISAPASALVGSPFTVSLALPTDPSAADTAAGFTYAFDCGSGYGPFSAIASASCSSTTAGPLTVRAKIRDKDLGVREYSATVQIAVTADSLCALVESYVTKNKGLANSLCVKLQNGAYEAFRNEVSAQTGKALSAAQAATLLGAVDALAGS